jgi:hypothetical protein
MFMGIQPLEPRQLLAAAAPNLTASAGRLVFNETQLSVSRPQWITLTNTGSANLSIDSITLAGADAAKFTFSRRRVPATLAPGASASLKVSFAPTDASVRTAALQVATNDADTPLLSLTLRGLGTTGRFENAEPSLQRVLDALQIPVSVGDKTPDTSALDGKAASEEVAMPFLKKAGPGPVRMTLLAAFSWDYSPVAQFGWFRAKGPRTLRPIFTAPAGNAQTLNPAVTGTTRFDPGAVTFGLFSTWPIEPHGPVFSDDASNTWDKSPDNQHKIRFYPYRKSYGRTVPNTYVVAMEEAANSDFQDAVLVIENVVPYDAVFAPSNLVATPSAARSITLAWTDNSDNETSFVVERSRKKNGTYSVVATLAPGTTRFTDTSLADNTRYYYRVRAVTAKGLSATSNRAVAQSA